MNIFIMFSNQRKSINIIKKNISREYGGNPNLKLKCVKSDADQINHIELVKEKVNICPNERQYKTPQMNTILRAVNQIENVQSLRPQVFKKDIDLTPRSKAVIAPKITQRLNFNTDQVVFKNLTPINVNDTILIQKQCSANPNKYKKTNKTPTPNLCHWLDPIPSLKHEIPEPEITLEFGEIEIDPFESYLQLIN